MNRGQSLRTVGRLFDTLSPLIDGLVIATGFIPLSSPVTIVLAMHDYAGKTVMGLERMNLCGVLKIRSNQSQNLFIHPVM